MKTDVHGDENTCSYAAENGHLDCLVFAHENGCPWNKQLEYGCPHDNIHSDLDI